MTHYFILFFCLVVDFILLVLLCALVKRFSVSYLFILFSMVSLCYIAKVRTVSTLYIWKLHTKNLPQNCFWSLHHHSSPSLTARGIWCNNELLGFDRIMSVAPGTRPGQGGSSGMHVRKLSSFILKSSNKIFMFLSSFGNELNSLGPNTLKLSNRFLSLVKGTTHLLPLFSFTFISCIPGLGTISWSTFQT